MFDLGYHFKHVDTIFDRVFASKPETATITTSSSTGEHAAPPSNDSALRR